MIHWCKERHGFRLWLGKIRIEVCWWATFCFLLFEIDDEGAMIGIALPPGAFWIHFPWPKSLTPQKKCIATWDGGRMFWLVDERECKISFHDWTLQLVLWGKTDEWAAADPWWIKGVRLDFRRLLLGREQCEVKELQTFPVIIPMPEGTYPGKAVVKQWTWTRPRWFSRRRIGTTVDLEKGIPFPGKGENSWDCGMDGLWGYGSNSTKPEEIIADGVRSAMRNRQRYAGSAQWVPKDA